MQILYVLRGPIGSGKTTLAQQMKFAQVAAGINVEIRDNEDYFMVNGKFVYDHTKLSDAIEHTNRMIFDDLAEGKSVIATGCFTRREHFYRIKRYAEIRGIKVQVISVEAEFDNVHGASEARVERSRRQFER